MCQSIKDKTLLLQYNPNNTQAFVPKKPKWIKLEYFSPYNKPKRAYFQTLPPQVRNTLRKQYKKYISYDGSSFYKWNIDGMSEHQIINLLHEMMMVANAYRIKTNNYDFHVVGVLVIGFTGLLKG